MARWASHSHRDAGVVSPDTLDALRFHYVPALSPGGCRSLVNDGPTLVPSVAIAELHHWEAEDEERTALGHLGDAPLHIAVDAFRAHARNQSRRQLIGWSGTVSGANPPPPASGGLAPPAEAAARAGHAVLYVLVGVASEEAVARSAMLNACSSLYMLAPTGDQRFAASLLDRAEC